MNGSAVTGRRRHRLGTHTLPRGFIAAVIFAGIATPAPGLIDDHEITIHSSADVAAKRQELIALIWGASGFPSETLPASVEIGTPSPIANLPNLSRVDTLRIAMDNDQETVAVHFIPANPNHRLVIVHQGHTCSLDDSPYSGVRRTIALLLQANYSVLGMYMPHFRPDDCTEWDGLFGVFVHNGMFQLATEGSAMKYFVEPVAVGLNYLKSQSQVDGFPWYTEFYMLGLSGGGWTTTVYAALDPTIISSFPVAGSLPLYMQQHPGDLEQHYDSFYEVAGYPDLYVMGSSGTSRQEVQILNRYDSCCFGENQYSPDSSGLSYDEATRDYEERVQGSLQGIGSGTFLLYIDEDLPGHMISPGAVHNVILPTLAARRTCPAVPATCADASRAVFWERDHEDRARKKRLFWEWRGAVDGTWDFGNPTATTDYMLCVYADDVLITDYTVAAGGTCGSQPCWRRLGYRGYEYIGNGANADGLNKVRATFRSVGKLGRITVKGEGENLPLPRPNPLFTQSTALTVQLLRGDESPCWQSHFAPPAKTRTDSRFKDKLP